MTQPTFERCLVGSVVPFDELCPSDQLRVILTNYNGKFWRCCGATDLNHHSYISVRCRFLRNSVPIYTEHKYDDRRFEDLTKEEQQSLITRYRRLYPSGRWRWRCCNSQSPGHLGRVAHACLIVKNQTSISTLQEFEGKDEIDSLLSQLEDVLRRLIESNVDQIEARSTTDRFIKAYVRKRLTDDFMETLLSRTEK